MKTAASAASAGSASATRLVVLETTGCRFILKLEGRDAASLASGLEGSTALDLVRDSLRNFCDEVAVRRQPEDEPTAQQFLAGPLEPGPAVLRLSKQLRGGNETERTQRITAAYQRGRSDAAHLQDPATDPASFLSDTHQRVRGPRFLVLRGAGAPFATTNFDIYASAQQPGGVIDPRCLVRIHTTVAEESAYLSGLGALPPIPHRQ